mmetsp:Transcript_51256/g.101247  ORF Transcript_51256/g.101247 Transcript_51256/m.101247 type:complete len:90 (-) Transcript_51256:517-786(-)
MDESKLNGVFHPNPGGGGGGDGRLELLLNLFPKPGGAVDAEKGAGAEGVYVDEGNTLELSLFTPLVPIHSCNLLRPGEGSLCKTESLSK